MADSSDPQARAPRSEPPSCPLCGKPLDARYRPFCSRRCADIDLNRWLSGVYAIPAREADDVERPRDDSDPGDPD